MTMPTEIANLLHDMADNTYRPGEAVQESVYQSDKTISWEAYERAREIKNVEYLPVLYDLIKTTRSVDVKHHAYFVVGCIAKNTQDISATSFLLNRLNVERATTLRVSMLEALAEVYKPRQLDLTVILKLIETKGVSIRKAAFLALTNSDHNMEDYLLGMLATRSDTNDISAIIRALSYIGTQKSVEPISKFVNSRKPEIKMACQFYLPSIMVRANYKVTEICRIAKVPVALVHNAKEKINTATRQG
jgi:HEAT repeat protein